MLRQQLLRTSRTLTSRPFTQQLYRIQPFSSSLRRYAEQPAAAPTPDPRDQQIAEMKVPPFETASSDDIGEIRKISGRLQKSPRTKQARINRCKILCHSKIRKRPS
jgi:hypothetical protein